MLSRMQRSQLVGPLVALLIVVVTVSLTTDRFLDPQNMVNVLLQVSTVAIMAIGSTMVILTGGIDLSPGAMVALVSCSLAILAKNVGIPWPIAVVMVLALGVVLGGVNGVMSTWGRIPAFVVTLATLSIFRGLAYYITGGSPIFSISPQLQQLFYGKFLGIPLPFYYVVGAYVLAALFLRYMAAGRSIYAVGGNESAARLSGIHVNRVRTLAFVLAGITAAFSGVLMTARLDSGSPNYGVGMELQAIAAAVIGGASLVGGYGSIIATLIGAMTVALVQNGLNLNAVPTAWQQIILGVILAMAVFVDMWRVDIGTYASRISSRMRPSKPSREGTHTATE